MKLIIDIPEWVIDKDDYTIYLGCMSEKLYEILRNGTPLTESDDCVNRADLMEMIELMTDIKGNTVYVVRDSDIRKMPSVQPKRDKGEWIDCKGSNHKDYRKCSLCLHTQEITGLLNFCPICGANMRAESEDKE